MKSFTGKVIKVTSPWMMSVRQGAYSQLGRRTYKNIWGSNAPKDLQSAHKSPATRDEMLKTGGWRLDWEEDGRFVEWRIDAEAQSEGDKERVQKEWTKFRQNKGRDQATLWDDPKQEKTSGFDRGSESWWRKHYYDYEYTGSSGVRSMEDVQKAMKVLQISDAGDQGAIRASYLRLVSKWHPDRFQVKAEQEHATEMFRKVSDAYNMLKERG